jgi:hypothetical protein
MPWSEILTTLAIAFGVIVVLGGFHAWVDSRPPEKPPSDNPAE